MTRMLRHAAVLALAVASAGPLAAGTDQLAASAGLRPGEAAGMSLTQIAARFFNRGESTQDRQTVPGEFAMGDAGDAAQLHASARDMPGATLNATAAAHYNLGQSGSDRIPVGMPTPGMGADRTQLAAAARLGKDGGSGRSLTGIAIDFFNRGESAADRQTTRD